MPDQPKPLAPGPATATPLRLVPWKDIDGAVAVDYHMHTTYTDGGASVQDMVAAATPAGVAEVLLSEHVRHTSTFYPSFVAEVSSVLPLDVKVYTGIETKILDSEGHLDCTFEIASKCDAIVGSVHSPPGPNDVEAGSWTGMDPAQALQLEFDLCMAIVSKSQAHILGHPLGMSITKFKLIPLDHVYDLASACRDYNKAFELNPRYCPDPGEWINIVKRAGCKVSIASDAHGTSDVGRAWKIFRRGLK